MKQIRLIVSDLTQIYFHDLALQRCTSLLEREIKFTIFPLLVLLCLIFPSTLLGQQEIGRPIGEYFDQSSFPGAAENFSVAEDDHGVLYFGNASGVLEYDGQSWELITTNNNSSVYSLDVSDNNTVFVGSKGEFGYLQPDSTGKLMYASLASHIPDHHKAFGEVWETLCTPVGVYFRTTKKVFRWDPTNSFLQVWALDEAGQDTFHHAFYVNGKLLIYVIGKGLMEVEGQTLKMVRGGEKLRNTVVNVILPFPGGDPGSTQLLICSRNKGLFYYDGARFIPFPVDIDRVIRREQGYIYHGTSLPNGDIALSTYENGIYILSPGGVLNTYLEKNRDLYGGRARFIYSSNKSTTRNVWIALDNGLLLTEIPSPFSQYDANDGLSLPISQLVRSEGTLYAISRTGVFQHRFTSRLSLSPSFLPVRGLEGVHYNSHGDSPTGLLIGTDEGLFQIRNRRAYVVSNDSTTGVHVLNNDQEVLLAATSQGVLWYTQNGNDWRLQGRIEGLPIDIKDIVEYGNGTLLMSSLKNGLYRVQYVNNGEEVTEIAFTSQEVNISGSLDPNNLSLTYLDKTNQILAISPNLFGIHSFNPSSRELLPLLSQEQIAASNPIWASNQISGLSEDLSGNVWAYSTSNIAQLIPKPGGGFEINTTDRLSNMGANGLFHDLNRDIWIANVDGVLRKADATPPLADQPSLTVIRNVTLTDGKSVFQDNSFYPLSLADSTIRISPDESSIEFTFSATKPSFITEWQYQYYLDGLDDTWSTPTDNNTAIYANLEPGNYIFKVRAFDDRGVMSEEETVALLVDKFWYQQTWAIALFVLAGLLLLAGIFFLVRFLLNKRQSNLANTFRKQQKVRSRPAGFSFRDNKTTPVTPEQTPEIPVEKVVEVNEPKVETEELSTQNTSWVSPTPIEKEEPKPVVAEAKEIIAEKEEVQVAPEPQPQAQPVEVAPVVPKETETSFSANKNHEQEIQSFMAKFDQLGKLLLTKPDTSTLHSRIENILKEFISFDIYGYGMPSSDHPGMDFRYKVHSNNEIISLNGNGQVPDSIAEWCLIRKEALLIGDVASEYGKFAQPGPPKGMLTLNGNSTPPPRSLMYVPLQIQNQTRGFITLQSFLPNLFREYHLQILQNLGNYLSLYMGSMEGNSSVEAMQEKVYQQDKMASLGELTKGLTREIGSPTSYIAKNIKALKQNLTEASDVWYQYECLSPEDAVAQLKDIDRMKATKDYDKKVADIFDYAQNVLKGAHRIAEILKGIRTYIGQEDDLKTINIHPNLDSALLILRHLYKGRIKITRDYGNIPEIPVFPAKLNQAFINILVNAIKSIDGQGSIYVQTMATGNHIQINIRDTGKGISEEDKQYLFEPFIHMDHGLNGSRVGLALTKDIILLHQGTIEVDSQPGAGTMFRIQLPTRLNLSTMYGNS